jgi:hypothetical protein
MTFFNTLLVATGQLTLTLQKPEGVRARDVPFLWVQGVKHSLMSIPCAIADIIASLPDGILPTGRVKRRKIELNAITHLCKTRLENFIASRLNAIDALASLLVLHPDTHLAEFEHFASLLLLSNPPIRALPYADPDSRVTYVYPPNGNDVTIQKPLSLLADPKRAPFV